MNSREKHEIAKFPNFFQTYDEREDTKTPFCMHNVSFFHRLQTTVQLNFTDLQTTVKRYYAKELKNCIKSTTRK